MYQILLIPNITWQKNINQDSYVKVISDIIGQLNNIRNDLYWHSPISSYSELLDYPNVKQYVISIPTYPNSMRCHFNFKEWMKIIDWKNKDIDLVYSHLPEWTLNVVNLIQNSTNIGNIPVVGYTHWTEIKEITNYSKTFILNNINGLLEMMKCGVNTKSQKDLIIDNVRNIYSKETLNKLDRILTPHYLGIPNDSVVDSICENPSKTIVFNHRPQTYKDWPHFLIIMDKLWAQRQDFTVWVPLLDKSNRPYINSEAVSKKYYYERLRKCSVCYCPKQAYAGWSVSGTDALMNGLPVLFYDGGYYHELKSNGDFHKTDDEAIDFFNRIFDDLEFRNSRANEALEFSRKTLTWENRIKPINQMINDALDSTKPVSSKSVRRNEIIDFIHKNGIVTKNDILKELGWGVSISFHRYRKYILNQTDIYTIVDSGKEYYKSKRKHKVPFFV